MSTQISKAFKLVIASVVVLLGVCMFGVDAALAQAVTDSFDPGKGIDEKTYTNLTTFTQGIDWVYGFLIIVTGYVSKYVPVLNTINKGVYRVLAVAAVLGAGFFFGAGVNLITLLVTYTVSTSFYEVILKLLKKEKPVVE